MLVTEENPVKPTSYYNNLKIEDNPDFLHSVAPLTAIKISPPFSFPGKTPMYCAERRQMTNQRQGGFHVLSDSVSKRCSDWLKTETITNDRGHWRTTLVDSNLKLCQRETSPMVSPPSTIHRITYSFVFG